MLKKLIYGLALPGVCLSALSAAETPADVAELKVDNSGVVVDLKAGKGKVRTVPPVTVNSASELPDYKLPAGVPQDFYAYAHEENVAFTGGAQSGGMMSVSLLDAENMALAHSWSLRSALEGRRSARGKKLGAVGQALPSFGYSVNFGANQSYTDTRRYALPSRADFSQKPALTQPLFHGGRIVSGIREANINTRKVEEDIRHERLAVRYQVRSLYYTCMLNLKCTDVYRKQTQISKEYWQKTQKRFEAGDVPELDVLRYQVQYKLKEANYIKARNAYNTSMTQLLRHMGKPLDTNVVLNDAFDFTEFDPGNEQELTAYALANRPDLKSAQMVEQMRSEGVKQAKAGLLPTLDGVASFTQGESYAAANQRYADNWNWSLGLQLNWSALAGMGQTLRGKIMEADAALAQAEFNTENKIDEVKQQVRNSVLTIMSSIEWVKSQRENVEQANRVLKQENIRWEEGAGDYLQILDAQNSVADAELSFWNGICTYKTAIVELEYSLGKFYQTAGNEVQGVQVKNPAAAKEKTVESVAAEDPFAALPVPAVAPATGEKIVSEVVPATVISENSISTLPSKPMVLEAKELPELPEKSDMDVMPNNAAFDDVPVSEVGLPEIDG